MFKFNDNKTTTIADKMDTTKLELPSGVDITSLELEAHDAESK